MISVRTNTLRSSNDEVISLLKKLGGVVVPVEWSDTSFLVDGIEMRILTETAEYCDGKFYIQSLPSQIPAIALEIEPSQTVLDLCAAPGSKTTQMAALLGNTGTIVANDVSRDRLFKLKANCGRMGVTNVQYSMMPGAGIWRKYPNYFDKVLCDVPCSMGQAYAPKNLKMLVSRQKSLIRSAYSSLKPGSVMVYSTCSPRTEENENVVEYLLKHEQSAEIMPIMVKNLPAAWIAAGGTVRMLKNDQHEDFFVALIRKNLEPDE